VSFEAGPGQLIALLGPNGAGKSTLLGSVATIIKPESGTIFYNETDVIAHPGELRKHMGYAPQDVSLYEPLSGTDNLRFWADVAGLTRQTRGDAIARVKDIIGFTDEMLRKSVQTYSGGMKQRLNIGVALLSDPDLIILDEPTAGVDIDSARLILDAAKQLRDSGKTIVWAGHHLDELEEIATHFMIMNKGKVKVFASREELLAGRSLEEAYRHYV